MTTASCRVGIDPIDRTVVVDNHDAAYVVWRDAGVKTRTLIHVDAHHDMWRAEGPEHITIANFISAAFADGLVRQVFWIVPDPGWESARARRPILRHLRKLAKDYPAADGAIHAGPQGISMSLSGRPLTVCPLRLLPRCDEHVLLDIDVDFMIIPRVAYGTLDQHAAVPWCWPADVIDRLRAAGVQTDLVTIARSVEGGYTPLKWKYLADELAQRLADPGGTAVRGMDLMRDAAVAAARGDLAAAEQRYQAAATALPACAAPAYHLAQVALQAGRTDDARRWYRQATTIEPAYATPFGHSGFPLYWDGRHEEAEQEFRRALQLDPRDPYAHLGLGLTAVESHRWNEAAAYLRAALSIDERLVEGHRALGRVLTHAGRRDDAIAAYERSLQLTLAGERPLAKPIVTTPPKDRLVDPGHCRAHAELARLYAGRGATARAIVGYQMSIAGGYEGPAVRNRLAWLYIRENQWIAAGAQLWALLRAVPWECRRGARRASGRLLRWLQRLIDRKWSPPPVRWREA